MWGEGVCCVCVRVQSGVANRAAHRKEQVGVGGWEDESEQPARDVQDPSLSKS